MNRNIPLSIDDELLAEVDRTAEEVKENRSAVMRKAIREGLALVKTKGDIVSLDGELSADVATASKDTGLSRGKVLLEAIRVGLQPFYSKRMREKTIAAQSRNPEEAELLRHVLERSDLFDDPMGREMRTALIQRGMLQNRLDDLLRHVPEAKRRVELIDRLVEFRHKPDGPGGGMPIGLSTEELEYQVGMSEKYGPHPANWPEAEKSARAIARESKGRKSN